VHDALLFDGDAALFPVVTVVLMTVVAAKHAHHILLIHSILSQIGANGELAMLSPRNTGADRIKLLATP
jgi:hypothetical protein